MSIYFSSDEKPHIAQMISLLRGAFLVIPAVFLAFLLRSIVLVWLAVPISELITTITAGSILLYKSRKAKAADYRIAAKTKSYAPRY
jgi:Na+-driven multidrug efflux pump